MLNSPMPMVACFCEMVIPAYINIMMGEGRKAISCVVGRAGIENMHVSTARLRIYILPQEKAAHYL